jgi:hypothetical protein
MKIKTIKTNIYIISYELRIYFIYSIDLEIILLYL